MSGLEEERVLDLARGRGWYVSHSGGVVYVGLEQMAAYLNVEHLARRLMDARNGTQQGLLFDRINDLDVALAELDRVLEPRLDVQARPHPNDPHLYSKMLRRSR